MGWYNVCIESFCTIINKSICWSINKSVKEEKEFLYVFLFHYLSIGYSIPMFSGFVIMFISTLSKHTMKKL